MGISARDERHVHTQAYTFQYTYKKKPIYYCCYKSEKTRRTRGKGNLYLSLWISAGRDRNVYIAFPNMPIEWSEVIIGCILVYRYILLHCTVCTKHILTYTKIVYRHKNTKVICEIGCSHDEVFNSRISIFNPGPVIGLIFNRCMRCVKVNWLEIFRWPTQYSLVHWNYVHMELHAEIVLISKN